MEKDKQTAKPMEVEMPRPALYLVYLTVDGFASDGLWLHRGADRVIVKKVTNNIRPIADGDNDIGHTKPGLPHGPRYTGPIDDETMANILIYGT